MKTAKVLLSMGLGLGLAVVLLIVLSPDGAQAQTEIIFFESCFAGTNNTTPVSCTIDADGLGVWLFADFADENGSAMLSAPISSTEWIYSVTLQADQVYAYQQQWEWYPSVGGDCFDDISTGEHDYDPAGCLQYAGVPNRIYAYRPWYPGWGEARIEWHFRITAVNGVPVGDDEPESGCANSDPDITSDTYWRMFGDPVPEILPGGGVTLTYLSGIVQGVDLSAGVYLFEISATIAPDFPQDQRFVELCLGSGCATVPIITDTYTSAQFNVLSGGDYEAKIINASTSLDFPTNTITITYACLNPIDNPCIVLDPDLEDIKYLSPSAVGWHTMFDDVPITPALYPDRAGARLFCDKSVEQWVYLGAGVYTMTLTGQAHSDNWWTRLPTQLTVNVNSSDPTGEYRTYYIEFDTYTGASVFAETVTKTLVFEIVESGDYLIQFANYDCEHGGLFSKDGVVFIDRVCLARDDVSISSQIGQCATLIDANFSEYEARSWNKAGNVTWSPGFVSLGENAGISQTVRLSSTAQMTNTEWIVYAVAKGNVTSTLRAGLGTNSTDLAIIPSLRSTYATYTTTLTSTMPAAVSLLAVTTTGGIDVDFVCVYYPGDVPAGEWDNGSDGDTECIKPELPPGGLSLGDTIQAWLSWVGNWIEYLVCLMVLWLRRIWLALTDFANELVIDLGLDAFLQSLVAWVLDLLQGPYDVFMLGQYALNLMFDMAARAFELLFSGATLGFLFFSSIMVGLELLGSLLTGFWSAIAAPCDPAGLPVPGAMIQGFLLVEAVINQIDEIGVIQSVLIGVMGLAIIIWTVNQFKTLTGGGSE